MQHDRPRTLDYAPSLVRSDLLKLRKRRGLVGRRRAPDARRDRDHVHDHRAAPRRRTRRSTGCRRHRRISGTARASSRCSDAAAAAIVGVDGRRGRSRRRRLPRPRRHRTLAARALRVATHAAASRTCCRSSRPPTRRRCVVSVALRGSLPAPSVHLMVVTGLWTLLERDGVLPARRRGRLPRRGRARTRSASSSRGRSPSPRSARSISALGIVRELRAQRRRSDASARRRCARRSRRGLSCTCRSPPRSPCSSPGRSCCSPRAPGATRTATSRRTPPE